MCTHVYTYMYIYIYPFTLPIRCCLLIACWLPIGSLCPWNGPRGNIQRGIQTDKYIYIYILLWPVLWKHLYTCIHMVCCVLRIASCLLPLASCLLPAAYCLLLVAYLLCITSGSFFLQAHQLLLEPLALLPMERAEGVHELIDDSRDNGKREYLAKQIAKKNVKSAFRTNFGQVSFFMFLQHVCQKLYIGLDSERHWHTEPTYELSNSLLLFEISTF